MTSSTSPALFAESLAAFSKTACQALADVEARSRTEVAHANNETHEARIQRDKAVKELHASHLEIQTWKQETNAVKATLAQAELTIVHQTDTIAHQTETIAQLRREVTQWKDQSRNWQEHFLRVEQERCALSSRMDELVSERLQWSRTTVSAVSTFTPNKPRCADLANSAPSSVTIKRQSIPSPTQPPAYNSAVPSSPPDLRTSGSGNSRQLAAGPTLKQRGANKNRKTKGHAEPSRPASETSEAKPELNQSSASSYRHQPPIPSGSSQSNRAKEARAGPRQTVIRRVQAVINVKQEESEDEDSVEPKEEGEDEVITVSKRPRSLRRRNRVVEDEEGGSQEGEEADEVVRQLRERRNAVDYHEDEADDEEDELMMSAPENHDYRAESIQNQRTKHPTPAPPKKKRKVMPRT